MRYVRVRLVLFLFLLTLGVAGTRLLSPPRVLVEWHTASEVNTAGFLLYRAPDPEGPFTLLTQDPIPARGDPLVGAAYRYEDRDVYWGQRYFYRLEEVERDGSRHPQDPVVTARAGAGWGWALVMGVFLSILGAAAYTALFPRDLNL